MNAATDNTAAAEAAYREARRHLDNVEAAANTILELMEAAQNESLRAAFKGDHDEVKRYYREALKIRGWMDSIQNATRNAHSNIDSKMRNATLITDNITDHAMTDFSPLAKD